MYPIYVLSKMRKVSKRFIYMYKNSNFYSPVLISSQRNLFILNKIFISDIILITCREFHFEVVLVMFISLKWVIFLKMRCPVSKIMSKMTHVHNKNTNNCF